MRAVCPAARAADPRPAVARGSLRSRCAATVSGDPCSSSSSRAARACAAARLLDGIDSSAMSRTNGWLNVSREPGRGHRSHADRRPPRRLGEGRDQRALPRDATRRRHPGSQRPARVRRRRPGSRESRASTRRVICLDGTRTASAACSPVGSRPASATARATSWTSIGLPAVASLAARQNVSSGAVARCSLRTTLTPSSLSGERVTSSTRAPSGARRPSSTSSPSAQRR